jgi:N-acetylglucosaminyldiphosphoundecaprenol N-acetyl-beta-D-mannosaminyltransferase
MQTGAKANLLGCRVDMVTMQQAIENIEKFIEQGQPAHIITLNAEIAYQARDNQPLRDIINAAAMVTADGIGTVWGARQLGWPVPERVTGIDLLYLLCKEAARRGWPVFLLGAAPGVAEAAATNLTRSYPGLCIAGTHHGYFKEEEVPGIIEQIRSSKPAVLLAALGAPKQEFFIHDYQKQMEVPVCIGVGGSFDVVAGLKKRAPEIIIKLNLEWLYRLCSEPSRIKRQMVLPKFAGAVLRQKWSRVHPGR